MPLAESCFNTTGVRGADAAKTAWTRLTKLGLAMQLLGGVNAHIGPFLQLIHKANTFLFGEKFDEEFDAFLRQLDVFSLDYLSGMAVRGRPFEMGNAINPVNLMYKFVQPLGPAIGMAGEAINKFRGGPGAPTIGQMAVRGAPFGIQAERSFGEAIQRYFLEPPARLLHMKPKEIKLKQGQDLTERITGRAQWPAKAIQERPRGAKENTRSA